MNKCQRSYDPEHPGAEVLRSADPQKQKASQCGSGMRQINCAEKYPGKADPINRQEPREPPGEASPWRDARRGALRRRLLGAGTVQRRSLHVPDIRQHVTPVRPRAMHDERKAVQSAPDYKSPSAAVPQSAEQHRDHDVAVDEPGRPAISPERNVKIIAEPAGETDVPAMPEVRDVRGEIRETKIDG